MLTTASRLAPGDIIQVSRSRRLVVSHVTPPRRGKVALAFNTEAGYFNTTADAAVDRRFEVVGHDDSYDSDAHVPNRVEGRIIDGRAYHVCKCGSPVEANPSPDAARIVWTHVEV